MVIKNELGYKFEQFLRFVSLRQQEVDFVGIDVIVMAIWIFTLVSFQVDKRFV